jgi:pyruvate dehydrogenase (quinone)
VSPRRSSAKRRERIEKNVAAWWDVVDARALNEANPINPQRVFTELSSRLPDV